MGERWPSIYSEEQLREHIQTLRKKEFLEAHFYDWRAANAPLPDDGLCQGDIVALNSDVPLIHADGQPATIEHDTGLWLVIGNTCDFSRTLDDAEYTQVVPIRNLGPVGTTEGIKALRAFETARAFYLPTWRPSDDSCFVADFLQPVTVHKGAFTQAARVEARMGFAAWVLLNACLVRFVARSDGRND